MIEKVHIASFPAASMNTYITSVVPIPNCCPGWWVLITVGSAPLSSVAVGSVQVTTIVDISIGMVYVWESGHPVMTGGAESTAVTVEMYVHSVTHKKFCLKSWCLELL